MDLKSIRANGEFSDQDWILVLESYILYTWNMGPDDLWFHAELSLGASKQPLEDTDTIELR
tara:strand:+ start:13 stop:195 length:183 start_codon:yes stop_codon:yes gene_type:complete